MSGPCRTLPFLQQCCESDDDPCQRCPCSVRGALDDTDRSNYFDDDDALWDEPSFDPDRTSQIDGPGGAPPERTSTHHVVAPRAAARKSMTDRRWGRSGAAHRRTTRPARRRRSPCAQRRRRRPRRRARRSAVRRPRRQRKRRRPASHRRAVDHDSHDDRRTEHDGPRCRRRHRGRRPRHLR